MGAPLDSGPMAMFYNKEVFDANNVDVPTTWDEFLDAARTLKEQGIYIVNDTGDAGFTTSMIWQAGGRPYQVNDTTVSVDFADEGTAKFAELWQTMIDEELVAPISSWSDEWYQALGDGSVASLVIGAWMPGNLETGVPAGAGKWAVADMPQWSDSEFTTSENGGSSMAVMKGSDNQALAYEFLEFTAAGEGIDIRVDGGAFPQQLTPSTNQDSSTENSSTLADKKSTKYSPNQQRESPKAGSTFPSRFTPTPYLTTSARTPTTAAPH